MTRSLLPLLCLLLACEEPAPVTPATFAPETLGGLFWTGHLLAGRDPTDVAAAALTELAVIEARTAADYATIAARHDEAARAVAAALTAGRAPDDAVVTTLTTADAELRALAVRATAEGLAALGPADNPALPDAVRARGLGMGPLDALVVGHSGVGPPDFSDLPPPLPATARALFADDLERELRTATAVSAYTQAVRGLDPASADAPATLASAVTTLGAALDADLRARLGVAAAMLAPRSEASRSAALATEPWGVYCDIRPAEQAFPFATGALLESNTPPQAPDPNGAPPGSPEPASPGPAGASPAPATTPASTTPTPTTP